MLFFRKALTQPCDISPYLGCDPEFFFKFKGEIIGAEKFLPKGGLANVNGYDNPSKFIIDGVQAELNPRPNYCRANLANEIKSCFKLLAAELKKKGSDFTVDFSRTVEISTEKLDELDESSKKFGCAPSKSISKTSGLKIESINPETYRIRAAGGHIHIGKGSKSIADYDKKYGLYYAINDNYEKVVEMLDLIVGNTSVLVDRDLGNIERRKVYGRAGEYRLPKHGLEYRTLSNYWLTSYPLMSLAFGLTRHAVQLMSDSKWEMYYKEFMKNINLEDVHKAINENDFNLAMDIFSEIELLIKETAGTNGRYAIHKDNMLEFHHFTTMIQAKGMNYWFPDSPMKYWTTGDDCHNGGMHDYLIGTVRADLAKHMKIKPSPLKIATMVD